VPEVSPFDAYQAVENQLFGHPELGEESLLPEKEPSCLLFRLTGKIGSCMAGGTGDS
jgi:hypothetical protein